MNEIHYIGFDVHKKTMSYCAKTAVARSGRRQLAARREALRSWAGGLVATVAGGDGSNAVQRLDLRHAEALCGATRHGTSGAHEGDYGGQEEERPPRCAHHCRPAALQPAAHLLCALAGDAGPATTAPLSPSGRHPIRTDAEQDCWPADGKRRSLRQSKLRGKKYFRELVQAWRKCRSR